MTVGTARAGSAALADPADPLARAALYQRHDLVWLLPGTARLCDGQAGEAGDQQRLDAWCASRPLVVARRPAEAVRQGTLHLGFCLPASAGGSGGRVRRLAVHAPEAAVVRHRPPLAVAELQRWQVLADAPVQPVLAGLQRLSAWLDGSVRIIGSYAWGALAVGVLGDGPDETPGSWVHAGSDLDVLVTVPRSPPAGSITVPGREASVAWRERARAVCRDLATLARPGHPALDGEVRFAGVGDVAWREWAGAAPADRVLWKDASGVWLAPALAPLAGLLDVSAARPLAAVVPVSARPSRTVAQDPYDLDRRALAALRAEAAAWPKPGLVSRVDAGSHTDMDHAVLQRAIAALEGWFAELARAAQAGARLADLAAIGRAAEAAMLLATGGVNAYRGAVFNLGLLVAATALEGPDRACRTVAERFGVELLRHPGVPGGHGEQVRLRDGLPGAREQAAAGFPVLTDHVLPALRAARAACHDDERSLVAACLAGIAALDDVNLLWRGGRTGLAWAQQAARRCLDQGGVQDEAWLARVVALHQAFVARRLSPGGTADLVGCAHFLAGWDPVAPAP